MMGHTRIALLVCILYGYPNFVTAIIKPLDVEEIFLGLFTEGAELQTKKVKRDDRECEEFKRGVSEKCKYYEDCCKDPMRLRERLLPGTFSCHPLDDERGLYVVDRCPAGTSDKHLQELCEEFARGDVMSLKRWPVTGVYSGITYRNVYCGICNGVFLDGISEPGYKQSEEDGSNDDPFGRDIPWYSLTDDVNQTLPTAEFALTFWWGEIICPNETLAALEHQDEVTGLLKSVSDGTCSLRFAPPMRRLHNCQVALRRCPEKSNITQELRELCESSPVDYITVRGQSYRNLFCAMCWLNKSISNEEVETKRDIQPPLASRYHWVGDILQGISGNTSRDRSLLVVSVKPVLQVEHNHNLSTKDFSDVGHDKLDLFSLTNDGYFEYLYDEPNELQVDLQTPRKAWNFGSILCHSHYDRFCSGFLRTSSNQCAGSGCGKGLIQEPSGGCLDPFSFQYDSEVRMRTDFVWPDSLLGRYYSRCRAKSRVKAHRMNCQCDKRCLLFGECCEDAFPNLTSATVRYECVDYRGFDGYAVINSCSDSATHELKMLCESTETTASNWRVSDVRDGFTFANVHCAQCHNVTDVVFWEGVWKCSEGRRESCSFLGSVPSERVPEPYFSCSQAISHCLDQEPNWKLSSKCQLAPNSHVYHPSGVYRNVYCAVCNDNDMQDIKAVEFAHSQPQAQRFETIRNPQVDLYATEGVITFDPMNGGCCFTEHPCQQAYNADIPGVDSQKLKHVCSYFLNNTCSCTELFDIQTSNCLATPYNVSCAPRSAHPDKSCSPFMNVTVAQLMCFPAIVQSSGVMPRTGGAGRSAIEYIFRADLEDKPREPNAELNHEMWEETNQTFLICGNESFVDTETGILYEHMTLGQGRIKVGLRAHHGHRPIKSRLNIYDYVLVGISLAAILIYILLYHIIKDKTKSLANAMHLTLLISLFGALLCFALIATPASTDLIACEALTSLTQFFFLSSHFWNNAIAINILRIVIHVSLEARSLKRFKFYAFYAFGSSATLTVITFILSQLPSSGITVYRHSDICFLEDLTVMYVLFLGPIYALIALNTLLGVITIVKINRSGSAVSNSDKDRMKKNAVTTLKLVVCLGLGWILLFISLLVPDVWPAFQVFVELQGLFLVLANVIGWKCMKRTKQWSSTHLRSQSKQNTFTTE